jgi:hypothetical protein
MVRTSRRPRRSSPLHLPSAFDLFTPSKEIVLKNIWIFGPLYAVPFIFWIHSWIWSPIPGESVRHWWYNADGFSSGWPGSSLPAYETFILVGFSILWFLIISVIGTVGQIMSQAAQLKAAEGERLDFVDLWKVVKELGWRLVGLYIVSTLAIVFSLFIFARRYWLAPYVMLDKKTDIKESMRLSAEISGRNPGSVWGLIGVLFLIGFVNIIPIIGGLASFIFGSLYSVAPALRYQQLKKTG